MTENSKLADMGSDNPNSIYESENLGEIGGQKISVSDHVNCLQHSITKSDSFVCLQHSITKSDSFVVDMERFSHLIEKEINSKSRVTLQRSLSRKGSMRNGERKSSGNERETSMLAISPRAIFNGSSSVPEKATVVVPSVGPDQSSNHHHHQITITSGSVNCTSAAAESKTLGKRPSFRRSSSSPFAINPRRLLFFFATLSCMGTILLIYFTLSIGKINGDNEIEAAALN